MISKAAILERAAEWQRAPEVVEKDYVLGWLLWGVGAPLEAIRFAGASRLLVEITYTGQQRVIEPYSLRRPRTGNLLLYGFERTKDGFQTGEIRAYKVAEIAGVRVLSRGFTPRFAIELNEQSGVWRG